MKYDPEMDTHHEYESSKREKFSSNAIVGGLIILLFGICVCGILAIVIF